MHEHANINPVTPHGFTPIYGAARNGHLDIVTYLVEKIKRQAQQLHKHLTVDLINPRSLSNLTPLERAADAKQWPVVRYLVEEMLNIDPNANINPKIRGGKNILELAIDAQDDDTVQLLIQHVNPT